MKALAVPSANSIRDFANRAVNAIMFYSLLAFLIVAGPLDLIYDPLAKAGTTWGITFDIGNRVVTNFRQPSRYTGVIIATLFFWWAAYYLWRHRSEGFFRS